MALNFVRRLYVARGLFSVAILNQFNFVPRDLLLLPLLFRLKGNFALSAFLDASKDLDLFFFLVRLFFANHDFLLFQSLVVLSLSGPKPMLLAAFVGL